MKFRKVLLLSVLCSLLIIVYACDNEDLEVSILKSLEISPTGNQVLELGGSMSFSVIGRDQKGQIIDIDPIWSIEGDIGTLNSDSGESTVFNAASAGNGFIVATAGMIFSKVGIEVVTEEVEVMDISPPEADVIIGGTITLNAEARDSNGNIINVNPVWSLDSNIGNINKKTGEEVVFTGILTGTCTITAEYNGFSKAVTLNVVEVTGERAEVSGYVTNGRGGPAVQGVNIDTGSYYTSTNEEGFFSISVPAGEQFDLVLSKSGYANFRVQDLLLNSDEEISLELPIRKVFHPDYSIIPPVISVINHNTSEELKSGEILSGVVNLELSIKSDENSIYVYYVYLGGEQRYPVESFNVEESETLVSIDTNLYPAGKSYLRVLAYDNNGNAVLHIVPVEIEKTVPEKVSYLELYSFTFGQNMEYYSMGREHIYERMNIKKNSAVIELSTGREIDLKSAPQGAALFTELYWESVAGADGYKIYRSFDGKYFELISYIDRDKNYLEDFTPKLAVGKTVYYRIIPFNSLGDGDYIERSITPLPALDVYLVSPANQARDVSLRPTFTWRINSSSLFPVDADIINTLAIYDVTAFFVGEYEVINKEEYTLTSSLKAGSVYTWDIIDTAALMSYYSDVDEISYAYSFAGYESSSVSGSGSINGEFIFSTITNLE